MEKFVIIEVGSTNTKAYLYENNEIKDVGFITIEFKRNYKNNNCIDENDKIKLYNFIEDIKENNIFVYGTSIFRNLNDIQKQEWLEEFKNNTGLDFTIVTSDMENEYTVYGATSNINYDGKIAVMIGGGGSTELSIVENGKIIEKVNSNYGAGDISEKYPDLRTDYATTDYNLMIKETLEITNKPENKADLLILAGGNYIYFYEELNYPVENNKFYNDPLQPYCLDIETMDKCDHDFLYNISLEEVCQRTNNDAWWRGARGMRVCVKSIATIVDAKYIIPTKISMVYGIANQIKNQ